MPVIFWTDGLVFVLLAAVISFALYARKHEHLRAPWRRVLETPASMAAVVIIGTYGVIGILDSLHFHPKEEGSNGEVRYANRVESVLDIVLGPLAEPALRQSLIISEGSFSIFFTRAYAGPIMVVALILLFLPLLKKIWDRLRKPPAAAATAASADAAVSRDDGE